MQGPDRSNLSTFLQGISYQTRNDLGDLEKRLTAAINNAMTFGEVHPGTRIQVKLESIGSCLIQGLSEIYTRYFGYKEDGVFVEIGAFDGEQYSNTCGLADLGWSGLYIEPVVKFFNQCRKRHIKNVEVDVLNLAVGDFNGEVIIYLADAWSTTSQRALANYKRIGWWKGKGEEDLIQMVTLNRLLDTYHILPGFDLLTIDVEGSEWDVVKSFDIDYWRPQMVIIELHDVSLKYEPIRDEALQVVGFFAQHGYRIVYKDLGNTIYVADELERRASMRLDLKAFFRNSPDGYCVLRMSDNFPQYLLGGDLDILCVDMESFSEYVQRFGEMYPEMEFRSRKTPSGHIHVDAYVEGKLHFRFDLVNSLQSYKKLTVSDKMLEAIMDGRVLRQDVWVPDDQFDLALRYMEYVEYIDERPDKIKHQHYVELHPDVDYWSVLRRYTNL